ncbi:polysaccharide deacetylase family protein [Acidobacteriota bacterium]
MLQSSDSNTPVADLKKASMLVPRLPVLAYHWLIADSVAIANRFEIRASTFKSHLKLLMNFGFHFIPPTDVPGILTDGSPYPEKPVCLTFDDGTKDLYTRGWPVLSSKNIPFASFIVASKIGQLYDWNTDLGIKPKPMLSWPQVKEMADHGVVFGSHTLTHPDLTLLNPASVIKELSESKKMIEDRIGREVSLLAYPYGRCNTMVKEIASRAGYNAAFGIQAGVDDLLKSELYDLKRALVKGTEGILRFRIRLLLASVRHAVRSGN